MIAAKRNAELLILDASAVGIGLVDSSQEGLARFLRENKCLVELDLSSNELARLPAPALAQNKAILALRLQDNNLVPAISGIALALTVPRE